MTANVIAQICCVVLLAALVQAQNDACYDAMKCITPEAKRAIFTQNKTEICRLAPAIVECGESRNKLCDDAEMMQSNAKNINGIKESLASCGSMATTTQTPTTTTVIKVSVKECAARFLSCDVKEVERARDQNDSDLMCNTFPVVIDCMENALSVCPETDDQNVPQMFVVLEKMRAQFASSKCTPEPESSRYDSASSLATSIMQTCIALILVTLLH